LVYLPGIDGTGRLLFRQPALFERYDVRCISYPQDRPTTYAELATLGAAELEPHGGIVLAESFGGAVALTLALSQPRLVHRLMLVNTFAWFPRRPFIKTLAFFGKYLPRRPASTRTRPFRGWFFSPSGISKGDKSEWWERTADVPMSAYGMRLQLLAGVDLRSRLEEIDVPAHVLVSPNDRIVPPCCGRLLAKRLPNSKLIEIEAGHAAMIHPDVDIAAMLGASSNGSVCSKSDIYSPHDL
jgi:pimeloyl-ACP methyl ester carboxylesterase